MHLAAPAVLIALFLPADAPPDPATLPEPPGLLRPGFAAIDERDLREWVGFLASDELERIFDPFYQVEDHMTRRHEGLGLGLPIVKRTVVDHNGRVLIRSNEHGTRVTITLPAAPDGTFHETPSDR